MKCWYCNGINVEQLYYKGQEMYWCWKCGATTCPHAEGIEPRYSWKLNPFTCINIWCGHRMESK